jgi:predicted enzyme related to lactoylglutathione lyase
MAKVLGIGGIFFKSPNPKRLYDWYSKWLGMHFEDWGTVFYPGTMPANGQSVWSAFPDGTKYFEPATKDFMFNLVVDNLHEALEQVKDGDAEIIGQIEKLEYGIFGWFVDPDGNKVELWEPSKGES